MSDLLFASLCLVWLVVSMAMTGCATTAWERANCMRFRHNGYNTLACDDTAVANKCRQICKKDDWGNPINYYPPACLDNRSKVFGRKPNILIGRSFLVCLDHEICHVEHPGENKMCAEKFPCVRQ